MARFYSTEKLEKKKPKRRTQEQILLDRQKEKKAVQREFKKQKDLLNHNLWEK